MKKTNTKKSTSTKKSPASKKASPSTSSASTTKKIVAPKKTVVKSVEKTPTPAVKKTAPKKSVTKKTPPPVAQVVKSVPTPTKTSDKDAHDGVKMIGILHLIGNLLSGGTLGIILVIVYYIFQKEKISTLERDTCFEIINFNLSFLIYSFVAGFSVLFIIGIVLFPIVVITWLILMIMGFFHHLEGKNYRYPFIIRFFS